MWGDTESLILLPWSEPIIGGRAVRLEMCEGDEVGEVARGER